VAPLAPLLSASGAFLTTAGIPTNTVTQEGVMYPSFAFYQGSSDAYKEQVQQMQAAKLQAAPKILTVLDEMIAATDATPDPWAVLITKLDALTEACRTVHEDCYQVEAQVETLAYKTSKCPNFTPLAKLILKRRLGEMRQRYVKIAAKAAAAEE
jgi:hypothetical protein